MLTKVLSIKAKLLAAGFLLTALTVGLGIYAQVSQREIGSISARIFDEAFLAMSHLRASQNGLLKLSAAGQRLAAQDLSSRELPGEAHDGAAGIRSILVTTLVVASLPDILDDLALARDRATSREGRAATAALKEHLAGLAQVSREAGPAALLAAIDRVESEFDEAADIFARDGLRNRRHVERLAEESVGRTWGAIAVSVAVALLVMVMLGRSIVPPLREAVAVAEAISAGRLDTPIDTAGRDETAQLLRALHAMQDSIAGNMEQIRYLADEASRHAGALAVQNGRFEAALNTMSQGLCLFDAAGRLAVFNQRFAEMFGAPALGDAPESVLARLGLPVAADLTRSASFTHALADGRVIAVSHQSAAAGGWVDTYEDVTERHRAETRLAHMARHDALTGLPNRVLFREELERLLQRGPCDGSLAILCLDLDGFKAVNDTLGHPIGDGLLREVAGRLRACLEAGDTVVRLGGDEFAIIQTGVADRDAAEALAERVVAALGAPCEIDQHVVRVGASVGIALADGMGGAEDRADALLRNADLALYHAKAEGRGTHRFFEPEMDARAQARRSLELDLRSALDRGEFDLHFQPLFNTERGGVSGFEALLRWRHPTRGMVSPAEFIPIAEETGLIKSIGAWVLQRACAEAVQWPQDIKVAVNLSPAQFRSGFLAADVVRALALSGLAPSRLELEITESVLLQDDESVLAALHQIRRLGVAISLDDFGTGYSSLSYLRRFPFDKIKIDQSFVRQIAEADNIAIIRAVLSLGAALKIAVVAEGVETAEQLSILEGEGCSEVQGYLFSPPRPVDQVGALIQHLAHPARVLRRAANG